MGKQPRGHRVADAYNCAYYAVRFAELSIKAISAPRLWRVTALMDTPLLRCQLKKHVGNDVGNDAVTAT